MNPLSMQETQHLLVTEPAWLTAVGARLWVTREGDPADHVLAPGERLALARGERVILGSWDSEQPAQGLWRPASAVRPAGYRFFDRAAGLFAALARSAASIASRAQGRISAGDSIVSAGTLR
jgi:Protein of unknown function (DUF2917)